MDNYSEKFFTKCQIFTHISDCSKYKYVIYIPHQKGISTGFLVVFVALQSMLRNVKSSIDFYYATIAYHVGLIAVLGWPQGIMANV